MSNISITLCKIPTEENSDSLYVKVKNMNQELSRQITINAYSENSPIKESLPVYVDTLPTQIDTLEPETEKTYRIDVSNLKGKVIFEITQKMGSSGIRTLKNSNNPSLVELHLK